MLNILGISCYFHDASAVLLQDGKLIAAAEEERFTRKKHDYEFPSNAIEFCLAEGNISGKDLDYVIFFEKPFIKFDRLLRTSLQGFPKTYSMFTQSMRTWMFDKLWIKALISKHLGVDSKNILFSEHHLSHAASSYFCSPFEESAILTFDGVGEWATTTMGTGIGNDIQIQQEMHFPHSIGLLYSAFTAFLGFEINEGEYKVMGMAPYGSPKYIEEIWKIVIQHEDGSFWLDPSYFSFHWNTKKSYTKKFMNLFGEPRNANIPFATEMSGFPDYYENKQNDRTKLFKYNQHYADLAASIQTVTEELILNLAKILHKQTGIDRLCLAGGVALNSVANGRILRETPFKEIYIQPSAGDGGGALGAALLASHCALGNKNRIVMEHAYWGKEYSDQQIDSAINDSGMKYSVFNQEPSLIDQAIDRLISGKVLGWFQGRFEWGPRALGNRSILADPRNSEMKDIVNEKIKFREPFRPFAPSVLVEESQKYFDITNPESAFPSKFMLYVVPVKTRYENTIQAVNHMGTARIQTVDKKSNQLYYDLIHAFYKATGTPMILNTSFNVRGEPIVNSPSDAINTFNNSGIDSLILGNRIIDKQ